MNISMANSPLSVLTQHYGPGLKSTEEKIERFQKTQSQISFFEGKKAELKDKHCATLEEIAQKLELFNNYNDQIDTVKKQFNNEQMMHCMDEAQELGEKIAEAAEKLEPKTAEERREDLAKEALGVEDEGGILEELLEDMPEDALQETLEEILADDQTAGKASSEELPEIIEREKLTQMYLQQQYTPIDLKA